MSLICSCEQFQESLKTNKFEPKGSMKAISKLAEDILSLFSKFHEFDTVVPTLKEGLSLKADKLDLQVCSHYDTLAHLVLLIRGFKCN